MYYRRKLLLALLDQFRGKLDKISLQKLLFLLVEKQNKKSFYFVPYKFGCYSFQASADLKTLAKYNQTIEIEKYWEKSDKKNYYNELTLRDQNALKYVKSEFGNLASGALIKLTYMKFPFFAINSTIKHKLLSQSELESIDKQKPQKKETVLFTIGYEGISLEEYINKLIVNDVKVLCDVRRNPISMKFGFNKNQLKTTCECVGIEYVHIPEFGVQKEKRQSLTEQADYDKLFIYYRKNILTNETQKQKDLFNLLIDKKRIALTCFESNINQCHRKHLAEIIGMFDGFEYEIKHI